MGSEYCGALHPENTSIVCTVKGNHENHSGFDKDDLDGDYEDWPNENYVPPATVPTKQAKSRLAATAARVRARVAPGAPAGFPAALEGSERSADTWTEDEKHQVDEAIRLVALQHGDGGEFTTDEIWGQLAGAVPVTKGLTARLANAQQRGIIGNTGKMKRSQRGGHHDHGQRLTIWYSLLSKK